MAISPSWFARLARSRPDAVDTISIAGTVHDQAERRVRGCSKAISAVSCEMPEGNPGHKWQFSAIASSDLLDDSMFVRFGSNCDEGRVGWHGRFALNTGNIWTGPARQVCAIKSGLSDFASALARG
jgi:hypothetical protein